VIRNIEIIGEAARNIQTREPEVAAAYPDIPWRNMTGMRNHLAHGYFEVDLKSVWTTVQDDLSVLREKIASMREALSLS